MKRVEFLKFSFLVISVIGSFCLLFIGAQQLIMRKAQQEQEIFHQYIQLPSIELMVPEEFEAPFFEIRNYTSRALDENWLSAEEAAELTAFLLINLLGTRIDGNIFRMNAMDVEGLRPWWSIGVFDEGNTEILYNVEVDAINGELLSFNNSNYFHQRNLQSMELHPVYPTSEIIMNWDENFESLAEYERKLSEHVREIASILTIDVVDIQVITIDAVIDSAGNIVDYLYGFRISSELRFDQWFLVSRNNKKLINFGIY